MEVPRWAAGAALRLVLLELQSLKEMHLACCKLAWEHCMLVAHNLAAVLHMTLWQGKGVPWSHGCC